MTTTVALAESMRRLREQALADPIFLGANILGYDYLKTPCKFHLDMAHAMKPRFVCSKCELGWIGTKPCPGCGADWRGFRDRSGGSTVTRAAHFFLALGPRGHIKTTLKSCVGGIYETLLDPNVRILLAQGTLLNSRKLLGGISQHYVENPVFRAVFPEYAVETREEEPNQYEFTVPCKNSPAKEPTFTCIGQDGAVTGQHFEIIDFDDVVYRENVPPAATPEQMERTWEWIQTFPMLLDQTVSWAHCRGSGTRWHDGDANGRVLSEPGYSHYQRIVYACFEADGKTPIWPSQFTAEKLERIRGEVGEYWFAANYLNDPMPADGSALFKDTHFVNYDRTRLLGDGTPLSIAITVDLAISEKQGADRTAIVVTGIDPQSNLYVLQAAAGRWTPYEIIDRLYFLDAVWKPEWVGIESVAYQKMMLYALYEEGKRRGKTLPVRGLMPDGNKVRRASMLSTVAQARGIFCLRNDPDQQQMIHECLRMTMVGSVGKHDDYVDALSYRAQYMVAPAAIEAVVVDRKNLSNWWTDTGDRALEFLQEKDDEAAFMVSIGKQ